jgi:hypothetical protein
MAIATRTSMIENPADRTCKPPSSQCARHLAAGLSIEWIQRDANGAGRRGAGRSQQLPTGLSKTLEKMPRRARSSRVKDRAVLAAGRIVILVSYTRTVREAP